jgi:hypothetical protein
VREILTAIQEYQKALQRLGPAEGPSEGPIADFNDHLTLLIKERVVLLHKLVLTINEHEQRYQDSKLRLEQELQLF